jgi:hypothetical protein
VEFLLLLLFVLLLLILPLVLVLVGIAALSRSAWAIMSSKSSAAARLLFSDLPGIVSTEEEGEIVKARVAKTVVAEIGLSKIIRERFK